MDVPVPQDVEQIINVPVGVREQVLLNGDWVTVTGDVAEYTKKLIASVARSKRKVNPAVVPDSQNVESERESRAAQRTQCSAVERSDAGLRIGVQRFKARAHETEMMTVGGRISECVVKQTVDESVETQHHDVEVVKVIPQERKACEDSCVAFVEATKIAEKDLVVTHPVRLAMALSSSVFQSEVFQNPDDVAGGVHVGKNDLDDVSVVTQRQIPKVQTVQKTKEIPQLQCIDKVVDNLVVQVPRVQVVEKTVEIPQLQTVEKIAETPQTQTIQGTQAPESLGTTPVCQVAQTGHVEVVEIETPLPTESASPMSVSTPVPQVVEELAEVSKGFLSRQGSTAFWRTDH